MQDPDHSEIPVLPPVVQPVGAKYWLGTISGRLMLINTMVFLAMSWESNGVLLPTRDVLLEFGAKDPVGLAQGEFWRFFTPIFVHIGIIHFFFNSLGLFYIGYQLERILGRRWYLVIYLVAGVVGNISSAYFSLAMSAGASGALFGLLGSGYVLERLVGRKLASEGLVRPRRRIYATMVLINVMFGLLVPGIDNAAHLGGLVSGVILTWCMLQFRANRLTNSKPARGLAGLLILALVSSYGMVLGSDTRNIVMRFEEAAAKADSVPEAMYYIEQALRILPDDFHLIIEKIRFTVLSNDPSDAINDIRKLSQDPRGLIELNHLKSDFSREGLTSQAQFLEFMMSEHGDSI